MQRLIPIIEAHAALEAQVGRRIAQIYGPLCQGCRQVCCQERYCRESLSSAFLALVRRRYPAPVGYDQERGWLGAEGCLLSVGRPPVCRQFNCRPALMAQAGEAQERALAVLSELMSWVGARALGRRHLVELDRRDQFQRLDLARLGDRLGQGERILRAAWELYRGREPGPEETRLLALVRP